MFFLSEKQNHEERQKLSKSMTARKIIKTVISIKIIHNE